MENKDAESLLADLEGKKGIAESGTTSSDEELQRLQQDVEKVMAAKRHHIKEEENTDAENAVGSGREIREEDRHLTPDATDQTLGEFALQVEKFMNEAEAAAIERPALTLLAAFSLGIIVGQLFSRR